VRRGRPAKQRLWLGPDRHPCGCDRRRHTNANANSYGYSYSNTQCDSYSDSDCNCNTNTERNAKRHTDSDTYCDSQRVAYGYAEGNPPAARDAAAKAVTLMPE
jgi:hypothetical protein